VVKNERIWAFIDSQNLNLGTSKDIFKNGKLVYRGWKLDFSKFRKYLADKFRVEKAIIFIGYSDIYADMYNRLKSNGYELVFKPTTKDGEGKLKGNVDAELVLNCSAIQYKNFDKAIIVAGDGDYRCLLEFLENNKKLFKIIIPNQKSESSLLKPFQEYKVFIQSERTKLELLQQPVSTLPNKKKRRKYKMIKKQKRKASL
jgi:uncharacterized LabA/DUF88 family protein